MTSSDVRCEIFVNGETRQLDPSRRTLQDLIEALDLPSTRGLAVAVNDRVVRLKSWPEHALKQGDRVEILHATQGG